MMAVLFPVERKLLVAKAPIQAKLQIHILTEIVRIKLDQISQDRLLFR